MARLSYIERDQADPSLHSIYDAVEGYGSFANQTRTMAHCPPILKHIMPLLSELQEQTRLSRRHIELLNVTVAKLNACQYCIDHHAPTLRVEGLSDQGIDRLPDAADHPELDECDRLVVDYAVLINNQPERVTDGFFAELQRHFSEAAIAELTWRIGLAGAFNRINLALEIETESDFVQTKSTRIRLDPDP
ncbi:MAG: carboxymuconolactone decarboxylase family protein [Geminicoccaceae bacterium]